MRFLRMAGFSALHALMLYLLTIVWMNLSWQFGDEVIVAQVNEIVRFHIFNNKDPFTENFRKDLLFINCSYDKVLLEFEDEHGIGRRQNTDRRKLAGMLRTIQGGTAKPRLVVVDLVFDDLSPDDSVLYEALRGTNHLVLSAKQNDDDSFTPRWPQLNHAIAEYATTTDAFLKYNLLDDTIPFLPTAMVRESEGIEFKPWAGLIRTHPGWWMNSFIVDLPIRKSQLDGGEVLVWNLGQALELYSKEEIEEVAGNKVIIVGDIYDYDMHNTLLGDMPGPVIVANAYLGLLKGAPRIQFLDVLLVFGLYFFTTLYIIQWRPNREKLLKHPVYKWKVGKFVLKYLSYLVLFSMYSVLLYVITGRHFQLLLFGLYFNLFEYLVERAGSKLAE